MAEKKLEELMVSLGLAGSEESAHETTYDDIHVISAQDEGCCAEVYRHERAINQTITWVSLLGTGAVVLVAVILFSHFMFWNWDSPHNGEWTRTLCNVTVVPGLARCAGVQTVANLMKGDSPPIVECCRLSVFYNIRIAFQEGEIRHSWNVTEPTSLFRDREVQDPCFPAKNVKHCWYNTPSSFSSVETDRYHDAVDGALEYRSGTKVIGMLFPVIHCQSAACYAASVASALSALLMVSACVWAMTNPGGGVIMRAQSSMPWDDDDDDSFSEYEDELEDDSQSPTIEMNAVIGVAADSSPPVAIYVGDVVPRQRQSPPVVVEDSAVPPCSYLPRVPKHKKAGEVLNESLAKFAARSNGTSSSSSSDAGDAMTASTIGSCSRDPTDMQDLRL